MGQSNILLFMSDEMLATGADVQPGSMNSEAGIFSMTFDMSGSRLITAEVDKTGTASTICKDDDEATEESHSIHWRPHIMK